MNGFILMVSQLSLDQQFCTQFKGYLHEILGAVSLKSFDRFLHFTGQARKPPQGLVHVCENDIRFNIKGSSDLFHPAAQVPGLLHGFHECAVAHLDVQYQAGDAFGDLFAHN